MPSLISQLWNSKSWRTPPTPIALPWPRAALATVSNAAFMRACVYCPGMPISVDRSLAPMQHVDAVDRGNRFGVLDRLRRLDHRHQHGLFIEPLAHLGLAERGVAEGRAAAEGRAVALRRIEAGLDDRLRLRGVL